VGYAVGKAPHRKARKAARALVQHEMAREYLHAVEHHLLAMRDDLAPVLLLRRVDRRGDETEVAAVVVGHYVEPVRAVIDVVLVVLAARQEEFRLRERFCRRQITHLRGSGAVRGNEDPGVAAAAVDRDRKTGVALD